MLDDLCGFSVLSFGVGGRLCSNFMVSTVISDDIQFILTVVHAPKHIPKHSGLHATYGESNRNHTDYGKPPPKRGPHFSYLERK